MAGFFRNPDIPGLDPNANKAGQLLSSGFVVVILSLIAIVFRFTSRWLIDARILLDDWLILAAIPFAWAQAIVDINGVYNFNLGRHIATATPSIIEGFLAATWAFQLIYIFAIAFSKLSILALYWRIFHVNSFKIPLLITTSLTLSWLIACTFASIFSCIPIDGFWRIMEPSHCINNLAYYIGQAVGNITIDIILFSLPIFMISRLQISLSQKIAVMGIFLLGAFVTLTSVLRLWQLVITQKHATPGNFDPTFTLVGAAVWSTVESNLSIVCACLPSMRPLLRLVVHGTLRNNESYGNSYESGGNAPYRGGGANPAKAANAMWDRAGVTPSWTGSGTGSKRNSFLRVLGRDIQMDERGVRIDGDGFRVNSSDVPLVGVQTRSKSMKAYMDEAGMEMEVNFSRPKPVPRAVTSPTQGPGRVPGKNWFDAGNERVSESSDEISLAKSATVVESNGARAPMVPSRSISPISRWDKPLPLRVNNNNRTAASREAPRAITPAEPWGLEIEKTTDVTVTEDRRPLVKR